MKKCYTEKIDFCTLKKNRMSMLTVSRDWMKSDFDSLLYASLYFLNFLKWP